MRPGLRLHAERPPLRDIFAVRGISRRRCLHRVFKVFELCERAKLHQVRAQPAFAVLLRQLARLEVQRAVQRASGCEWREQPHQLRDLPEEPDRNVHHVYRESNQQFSSE